jgi:DNA-binding NarL/FixJ family response regulator
MREWGRRGGPFPTLATRSRSAPGRRFWGSDAPAAPERLGPPGTASVRVMLCHDVAERRDVMRAVLEHSLELTIVGEISETNAGAAVLGQIRPDVVLLDLGSPEIGRLDRLHNLREASPETAIVVLCSAAEPWMRKRLISSGAHICVNRGASFGDICRSIETASASLRENGPSRSR